MARGRSPAPATRAPTGTGLLDVGSKKFTYAKWGATGGAAVLLGLSTVFYMRAKNANDVIEADAGRMCGGELCEDYDAFLQDAASVGKTGELVHYITLGTGLAVAGVAGYLWFKQLTDKGAPAKAETSTEPGSDEPELTLRRPYTPRTTWAAVPTVSDTGVGAAALVTF